MTRSRKYHTELLAAAEYYEARASNLLAGTEVPSNLRHATTDQRTAHALRCRAAELRHHVRTCSASFHLVHPTPR